MISEVNSVACFENRFQGVKAHPGKAGNQVKAPAEPVQQILIADEHPLFREGVGRLIASGIDCRGIIEAADLDGVLDIVRKNPDLSLILLDMDIPGMHGLDGLMTLRQEAPTVPVLIVSANENKQLALQAIGCGAVGYVTKSSPRATMNDAIHQVLNGKVYLQLHSDIAHPAEKTGTGQGAEQEPTYSDRIKSLTCRQLLVFERMGKGESNKQIAYHLHISECTVKAHVSAILRKLGVHNRVQAVLCAGGVDIRRYLKQRYLSKQDQ